MTLLKSSKIHSLSGPGFCLKCEPPGDMIRVNNPFHQPA